ncbi:hypothetical protein GCM10027360_83130 [Amycolatopsis echigonensis]
MGLSPGDAGPCLRLRPALRFVNGGAPAPPVPFALEEVRVLLTSGQLADLRQRTRQSAWNKGRVAHGWPTRP